MFQDGRTRDEIAHNTLIKDTMRGSRAVEDILRHLCAFIQIHSQLDTASTSGEDAQHSVACLQCLAELVGCSPNLALHDLPFAYL